MDLEALKENEYLWDLFTRKEEYDPIFLDKHNRFIHKYSNNENILNPEVSEFLIKKSSKFEYPDNKDFAVCLTHDIDDIYPPISHTILSSLHCMKDFNYSEFWRQILWKKAGRELSPYCNFRKIMELEDNYNAKSSFYFITSSRDIKRFRYEIEDLEIELGYIVDAGWEVGLHGGYYTYNCLDEMKKEKKRLEDALGGKIFGYRNHYLRFKIPETWELLAEAGFAYDATLGYSDIIGFRNGMCHPFKPYNIKNEKAINILEINLNIMDDALFSSVSSAGEAWRAAKDLIDITKKYNGVITILWHNSGFDCPFRKEWMKLYEKILVYCYDIGAWMTSGIEICNWWNKMYHKQLISKTEKL